MHRRSLRVRLLAVVLLGIIATTAVEALVSNWGLSRVRDLAIDEERARNMTGALLTRIERERAHTVLLDITGVPVIDTHVAQALLRLVDASRLLGAEVVLVGVSPEVAQTIVTLGIDVRGLRTAADLRSAVEELLAHRRKAYQPTSSV